MHKKPDAVAYARSFLVEWKNRLENDQGAEFSNGKGIGQQFSRSFLSLFLRYAHENWPEKLSADHYELAVRDEKFRSAHYGEIQRQIKHEILITKPARNFLIALMKESSSKRKTGRPNADGWHHLLAVVIHNVSLKYDLTVGEDNYVNGRSAQAAVIIALSDLFPDSDVDYRKETLSLHGTIPGQELLSKTWEKWRYPLRPVSRKQKRLSEFDLVEAEDDVFQTFYLTHFVKLIERHKM